MTAVKKKKIVILGSTGSIGENAVKVAKTLSARIEVCGLAARNNLKRLAEQAAELKCPYAVTSDASRKDDLLKMLPPDCEGQAGEEYILEMVTRPDVDLVFCAIVGTGGLLPVLEAIRAGKEIALASKEVLVMAGDLVMKEAARYGVRVVPVDSEHSAIFQCLEGKRRQDVSRLILTCSGGPLLNASSEEIQNATYEKALDHPTWNMGPKVTIDSASLMNKALEIIEAAFLFGMPGSKIDVVIHPQSVIHSMVEFIDGTILAQMSTPDMRFPIQYAITYPEKYSGGMRPLDFSVFSQLNFQMPDRKLFPSLDFAYSALHAGGTMPAVMNAANEVAVARFSRSEIGFTDIWRIIEKVMSMHQVLEQPALDAILSVDKWARDTALTI
ncbi:MAG: 1-deoxy-D-xylulose-5-phosphate reductoisomerase [Lentisphaerota bacterium]